MFRYFALYKPYGYLSQFGDEGRYKGIGQLINLPSDVYSAGRLDADSEGLLIFTNDGFLKSRLLEPQYKHKRTYTVQVEGEVQADKLTKLTQGVVINIKGTLYKTISAKIVLLLTKPDFPERNPPIRIRKNVPTSWIQITLVEGKNRQVRKMTAAIGYPTLRLIRTSIENLTLDGMKSGELIELTQKEIYTKLNISL